MTILRPGPRVRPGTRRRGAPGRADGGRVPAPGRRRRRLWRALPWSVDAVVAASTTMRWVNVPSHAVAAGLQGVSPWLLLPVVPVAAGAVLRRRPLLAVTSLLLTAAQLVSLWSDVGHHSSRPVPGGAVPLRLVTANMLLDNADPAGFAAEVLRLDADVVLLQEVTPWNLDALKESGLLDPYPYQVLDPREGGYGSVVLSRLPLRDGRVIQVAGWPMTAADVVTPSGPVRLVNVHTAAPLSGPGIALWGAQLDELSRWTPPEGGHLLLAGDFNATVHHPPFRRLLGPALRDAFVEVGRGPGFTWPAGVRGVPAVMRLDHVLVSPGLVATAVRRTAGTGSDHHGLVTDLAVVPAGP